jgi:hypothetical protein
MRTSLARNVWIGLFIVLSLGTPASAADGARVYVVLWFDTEDYLLPASDDAALKIAEILTSRKARATFKVVGEKARTLEKRGRNDVIAALKKHEIGYHSNYHSTQPTPALYLSNLTWDDGVAEFDRRERQGFDDVKRIFGQTPTCYGQPGSSWGPQTYGAMRDWGVGVYLDGGSHVGLEGKPHFYCGALTLYQLRYILRAKHATDAALKADEEKFAAARQKLLEEGGGVVSVMAHPCEWVHGKFWDGVNFAKGANPPREAWKAPPQLPAEETQAAHGRFDEFIQFMQRFPDVQFFTASEAAKLYRDRARGRPFTVDEIKSIAEAARTELNFQKRDNYALSPAEVFVLLNRYVADQAAGKTTKTLELPFAPLGPTSAVVSQADPVETNASQFGRTAQDVDEYVRKRGRLPSAVWLGSVAVPPEAYLKALAEVAGELAVGRPMPEKIRVAPASLVTAKYVADDAPVLWGWVIFPPGFRAPSLMEVARRQAWTIKPALLAKE